MLLDVISDSIVIPYPIKITFIDTIEIHRYSIHVPKKFHDHPTSSWILSRKNKKSSITPNLSMPIIYLQDGAPQL